jgi:hypothetical protein
VGVEILVEVGLQRVDLGLQRPDDLQLQADEIDRVGGEFTGDQRLDERAIEAADKVLVKKELVIVTQLPPVGVPGKDQRDVLGQRAGPWLRSRRRG